MKNLALAFLSVLLLASCTTTEQANDAMASRFIGVPADSFFLQYGPPASSYEMRDGRTMYVWAEHPETVEWHGVSTATVTTVGNTAYVTGWSDPSSSITMQCAVRIVAGQQGRIQQILAQHDTVGFMQMSRCNEVFG